MGSACAGLSGGTVAYKVNLLPTVAQSSTEAEFMEAAVTGRMFLFCQSVMYDLGIPQCAATITYEDNVACTPIANAQKSTPCTRHIGINYHVLCQLVKQDVLKLSQIPTTLNISDIFTK